MSAHKCRFCGAALPEEGEGLEAYRLGPGRVFCPRCGGEHLEDVEDLENDSI